MTSKRTGFRLGFRVLATTAIAVLPVLCIPGTSETCESTGPDANGIEMFDSGGQDGFMRQSGEPKVGVSEETPAAGCPTPACSDPSCPTVNPATPFQRLPGLTDKPIFDRAGCFGVAKRDENFYVQMTMDGPSNGIHRHVSTDGGITWREGGVVIKPNQQWWTGLKCPDPHFLDTAGNMVMYFKAGGNPGGIGRAVSTNDGLTWTVHPAPVLSADTPGFYVDNPSVIRRNTNLWNMVYTFACTGGTGPFQMAETHIAVSQDGINWTKSPLNPVLTTGACGEFDHGALANPVLVQDPDSYPTLHLFYTGAGWDGQTTRGCAKFGHAISTNHGRTFTKTGVVLDHPPAGSVAWDDIQYMVSSYTIEGDAIRMYYWAQGEKESGLGVAEAAWPLAGSLAPNQNTEDLRYSDLPIDDLAELLDGDVPYLRTHPNPTVGQTVIEHNLSTVGLDGNGSLSVFDVQGRSVAQVWRGTLGSAPERFEWDGVDKNGSRVAAGRYLIRLDGNGQALATSWITVMK